jgi:multiple sugar transport system ATP-binding protein
MADIELVNVVKRFGNVTAVDQVNLVMKDKKFLVLLGPSGCGKTTVLRMIAGLELLTEGDIFIGGQRVTYTPPRDRNIAMVFQNYALYPHMSVYQNMSFGLKLQKTPKDEIDRRVKFAAKILGIEDLLERKPKQLSGGQRQRVAMGRAIVRQPQAFLFDEPLSNLDAKLRVQMRGELLRLHERLEGTIVYVTHDQIEAMTLADQIVVMNSGRIMQIGSAMEVYDSPKNIFVAGFVGSPAMNFLNVSVCLEGSTLYVKGEGFKLAIPEGFQSQYLKLKDKKVIFGIRPEAIFDKTLTGSVPGGETLKVTIDIVEPVGLGVILTASLGSNELRAFVDPKTRAMPHKEMEFLVAMDRMHLFDKSTGERL